MPVSAHILLIPGLAPARLIPTHLATVAMLTVGLKAVVVMMLLVMQLGMWRKTVHGLAEVGTGGNRPALRQLVGSHHWLAVEGQIGMRMAMRAWVDMGLLADMTLLTVMGAWSGRCRVELRGEC